MDISPSQVEPRRKRRFWIPVLIILLLLGTMATFVVYKGLQPKYSFLQGLEPVFSGDPYKDMPTPTPPAGVPVPKMPSFYMEIYSVKGSFEELKRKMEPEMRRVGATLQPGFEEQLKGQLSSMPAADRKRLEATLKDMPRSANWVFEKDTSVSDAMMGMRGISLTADQRFQKGHNLFMAAPQGQDKGWVTITIFETQQPTFFSKLSDWFKSVFHRP